jgi:glycosyltransferase involved in cell wall biosynthesis
MKLISVIVPVYNVEQYLRRCVDSILTQSYQNLEIILVDDGSTDSSGDICDWYKKQNGRIKVIHKENGGLSSARNAGLDIADGEYIGFVDSDDWIVENMYETLLTLLISTNSDVVGCRWREVTHAHSSSAKSRKQYPFKIYEHDDILINFFKDEFKSSVCSRLYKTDVIKNIRFFEGRIHEDYLFSYDVFSKCNRVLQSELALYMYYVNNVSISRNKFKEKNLDYIFVCNEVLCSWEYHRWLKRSSALSSFDLPGLVCFSMCIAPLQINLSKGFL